MKTLVTLAALLAAIAAVAYFAFYSVLPDGTERVVPSGGERAEVVE